MAASAAHVPSAGTLARNAANAVHDGIMISQGKSATLEEQQKQHMSDGFLVFCNAWAPKRGDPLEQVSPEVAAALATVQAH